MAVMSDVTIWHNSRCSKSRGAKELLVERGLEPEVRFYLEDPPSRDELAEVVAMLGGDVRVLVRRGEPEAQGLEDASDDELLDALAAHPRLIERPVVIRGGRAVVARPPEKALDLL